MPEVELRPSLVVWIAEGGAVRRGANDFLAGLCGAPVERPASEQGGPYCHRGAGEGTEHKRIGRCWQHDDAAPGEGLPPWVGEIDDDKWKEITGGTDNPGELTHGLVRMERARRDIEAYICATLPSELDVERYRAMHIDPVSIIDMRLKLNFLQVLQTWDRIKHLTDAADLDEDGPGARGLSSPQIRGCQTHLIRLDGAFCRLMEVRVRVTEEAEARDRNEAFEEQIGSLSADDKRRIAEDPDLFRKLMQGEPRANGNRGSG